MSKESSKALGMIRMESNVKWRLEVKDIRRKVYSFKREISLEFIRRKKRDGQFEQ